MNHIGTASTQKLLHTCSLCLHQWRVPRFALKYPCNPPPPPGDNHLVPPPHPGDRRALTREFAKGGGYLEFIIMCVTLSAKTYPIRTVNLEVASHKARSAVPFLRTRAGSLGDPTHERVKEDAKHKPHVEPRREYVSRLTAEALLANGGLHHPLRRRVAESMAHSSHLSTTSMELEEGLREAVDEGVCLPSTTRPL